MTLLITALFSYLVGSFPTAYLFDRKIFEKGSRNMGAFNILVSNKSVMKTLLVLMIDLLKGVIVVIISQTFLPGAQGLIIGVFFGLLGHDYSIFAGFKGGKGLAMACGALLLLKPDFLAVMSILVFALYLVFKSEVKAGLVAAPVLLIIVYVMRLPDYLLILGVIGAVMITHKDILKIIKKRITTT